MNTLKFKTNIKCAGCIAKASPVLNEKLGAGKWEVDVMTLKKTLTVNTEDLNQTEVIAIVNEAGFTAEALD